MATAMVTQWGMSPSIGYMSYADDPQQLHKPFSEDTAMRIDSEVKRIVDEAYKQCKDLLQEKKKEVGIVAEELLRKEVLSRDDMVRLLGKREWGAGLEFEKWFGGRGDTQGVEGSTPGAQLPGGETGHGAPPMGGAAPVAFKRLP
jgi:AFG3 family protein